MEKYSFCGYCLYMNRCVTIPLVTMMTALFLRFPAWNFMESSQLQHLSWGKSIFTSLHISISQTPIPRIVAEEFLRDSTTGAVAEILQVCQTVEIEGRVQSSQEKIAPGIFSKEGREGKKCQGGMHPTSIPAMRFSLIALEGTVERLFKHAENSVLIFLAQ